jgi:hypothetical protein
MRTPSTLNKTTRRATGIAITAAVTAAAVSVAQAPATAARSNPAPFTFLVQQQSAVTPDPSFPKPGDTIVVTQKNVRNGHVIGNDSTGCLVTNSSGLIQCTATVGLPGGFLEIAFPEVLGTKNITAPISSAAGRYAGTTGYFTLHQLSATEYRATLHTR